MPLSFLFCFKLYLTFSFPVKTTKVRNQGATFKEIPYGYDVARIGQESLVLFLKPKELATVSHIGIVLIVN